MTKSKRYGVVLFAIAILTGFSAGACFFAQADQTIQPYSENPWYWQYHGEPVVLIGGTDDDNLFQWTGKRMTDHLDLIVSVGGNYVRNTMSDRDEGNVYAFKEIEDGVYDLDQWNDEYWHRLTVFLAAIAERGIIVQLTLWDQYDMGGSRWRNHPWNPENNISMESGSWTSSADFYATLAEDHQQGLHYQQQLVDKILSITLEYGNVLYNINNESSQGAQWENYWAQYINQAAEDMGREAYVTSLQFDPSSSVRHVMTYRDILQLRRHLAKQPGLEGGKRIGPLGEHPQLAEEDRLARRRACADEQRKGVRGEGRREHTRRARRRRRSIASGAISSPAARRAGSIGPPCRAFGVRG